jgi:opacity protein-like surface antigen
MNKLVSAAALVGGLAVGLAAGGTPALAQIVPYVGFDLGYGQVDYAPNDVLPTDTGGQGWAPGLFVGVQYGMGPRLSLAGEFDWAWTNFKGGQQADDRIVEHYTKMPVNLKLSMGYRLRQTTVSAGFGFGRATIETTDTLTVATMKEAATGFSWLLGFRRDLSPRLFVRGEFARTTYSDVRFIAGDTNALIDTTADVWRVGFGRKFLPV